MSVNDERLRLLQERLDDLDCLALTDESVNAAPQPIARPAMNAQAPATPAAPAIKQTQEGRADLLDNFRRDLARITAEAESTFSVAVETRLNHLKTITDGMAQRFLAEIEAAMRQSAGVMTSQALRLAEEEVLLVARRGIEECAAASSGRRLPASKDQQLAAAATIDPARIAEAAMTKLEARLAASLRAFEEQAARRLAERLGAIIQDLLAREKASSAASVASQHRALIRAEPQPLSILPGAPLPTPANAPSPAVTPTKAPIPKDVPKSTKKTKWTVLGLG